VLDRWPNLRDLLLEDYEEKFTSLREAEGIGRPQRGRKSGYARDDKKERVVAV
jgi:hypothetical protein